MKEDLLHFVWKTKRFDLSNLTTSINQPLHIHQFGHHNQDAGPDFLHAKITIGNTIWVGHVEMHLNASDWDKHRHSADNGYNNVILHVVLHEDKKIFRADGTLIPCLVMKHRIGKTLVGKYQKLITNTYWIPCQSHIMTISQINFQLWLDRMLVDRLEQKTTDIKRQLIDFKQDWETVLYLNLAKSMGLYVNTYAFEKLAYKLPLKIILKHHPNLFQIEALLFGTAGMLLKDFEDDYPIRLKREYQFLSKKYGIHPMKASEWKYLRMRPGNFPTLRIAQFANILYANHHLFRQIIEVQNIKKLYKIFKVGVSNYWHQHFVFDKTAPSSEKIIGADTIDRMLINAIVPIQFLYGQVHNKSRLQHDALRLLEAIPAEKNSVIRNWEKMGQKADSAYETQALLHLKKHFCDRQRCMNCQIGNELMK